MDAMAVVEVGMPTNLPCLDCGGTGQVDCGWCMGTRIMGQTSCRVCVTGQLACRKCKEVGVVAFSRPVD